MRISVKMLYLIIGMLIITLVVFFIIGGELHEFLSNVINTISKGFSMGVGK